MTIDEVIAIFKEIKNTSSRNEKIKIIRDHKNDNEFISNLIFLLDNNITTGISYSKLTKNIGVVPKVENFTEEKLWYTLREWLINHSTGSNREIHACQKFLKSVPDSHKQFYIEMITKKYRLGCDYKTANEAIPGLIQVYETQQAFPMSEKNKPKKGEWFSLSEKLNGINGGFIYGKCLSRQGKEISGMQHIIKELIQLGINTHKYYVNGELIRINNDNIPDEENFRLTTSIVNSDVANKTDIGFVFYEIIPIQQFKRGHSTLVYKDRLLIYQSVQASINELKLKYIKFVGSYYSGTDQTKIKEWLDYADTHNKEGIMLNKNVVWQNKRNNGILKVKTFHTCDIKCIGVEEGDGKNKGILGNIICNYKGYNLGVGSGFTDSQRKYYWNHKDEIIGKIITVKYKTETTNQINGGLSLQFPVFITIRNDKDEEAYED